MLALLVTLLFAAPAVTPPFTSYADLDLRWAGGALTVTRLHLDALERPATLPLWRGRFVLRVLKGKVTVAEVAFDFPLLAGAESSDTPESDRATAERLRRGVRATTRVRVPLPDGADGLAIYDSATRKTLAVPLKEMVDAPRASPRAP